MLASVGELEAAFPLPHGRGDEFHHGSSGHDPRDLPTRRAKPRDIYVPDLHLDTIKAYAGAVHVDSSTGNARRGILLISHIYT